MGSSAQVRVIPEGEMTHHSWEINDIHFSSNGSLLVSSSYAESVCIWSVSEQELKKEIHAKVDEASIVCTAVSSLDLVAVGLDSGDISIWTLEGVLVDRITSNESGKLSLSFSPTEHILIAAYENGVVCVWDVAPSSLLNSFIAASPLETNELSKKQDQHLIANSPDGGILAIDYPSIRGNIQLWRIGEGGKSVQWYNALRTARTPVYDLAFSADSNVLAIASGGEIELFDVSSGASLGTLGIPKNTINRLAYSTEDHLLAAAGSGGQVSIWESANKQLLATFDAHSETVSWAIQDIAWAPHNKLLATCGWHVAQAYRAKSSSLKRPRNWLNTFPIRLWRIEER